MRLGSEGNFGWGLGAGIGVGVWFCAFGWVVRFFGGLGIGVVGLGLEGKSGWGFGLCGGVYFLLVQLLVCLVMFPYLVCTFGKSFCIFIF